MTMTTTITRPGTETEYSQMAGGRSCEGCPRCQDAANAGFCKQTHNPEYGNLHPVCRSCGHCVLRGQHNDDTSKGFHSASYHLTLRPQLGDHRHCGLAICTFHLGFSLVEPDLPLWTPRNGVFRRNTVGGSALWKSRNPGARRSITSGKRSP